ncbi:MAG TPA: hypothetical protein VIZ32_02820, partial [Vicinamibacterales bacterium]
MLRENEKPASLPRWRRLPLLLYAIVLTLAGLAIHVAGAIAFVLTETIVPGPLPAAWPGRLLVVSGGLVLLASALAAMDILVLLPRKRQRHDIMMKPPAGRYLTVVLTAFNDEASIGLAVDDFRTHPLV